MGRSIAPEPVTVIAVVVVIVEKEVALIGVEALVVIFEESLVVRTAIVLNRVQSHHFAQQRSRRK